MSGMKLTCGPGDTGIVRVDAETGVALFDFERCPVCLTLHSGPRGDHARHNQKHFSCDECMGALKRRVLVLPKLWPVPWGTRRGAPPRGGSK